MIAARACVLSASESLVAKVELGSTPAIRFVMALASGILSSLVPHEKEHA